MQKWWMKQYGKFKELMNDVEIEDLGTKKLAYIIRGEALGHYILFRFEANSEDVAEIERRYRIDEQIIKFIVVKMED